MTMTHINGFQLSTPASLTVDEVHFRGPGGLKLVVESRPGEAGVTAESLAAETVGALGAHEGVSNVRQHPMAFADGGAGTVVSCVVTAGGAAARQYVVFRVEGALVCTAAVTAPADSTQETAMEFMQCLASLRPG
jgi:hypothetical protein